MYALQHNFCSCETRVYEHQYVMLYKHSVQTKLCLCHNLGQAYTVRVVGNMPMMHYKFSRCGQISSFINNCKFLSITVSFVYRLCPKLLYISTFTRALIIFQLRSYIASLPIMSQLGTTGQLKFTFFAPNNFAFANVPQEVLFKYKSPSDVIQTQLNEIMLYHCSK